MNARMESNFNDYFETIDPMFEMPDINRISKIENICDISRTNEDILNTQSLIHNSLESSNQTLN